MAVITPSRPASRPQHSISGSLRACASISFRIPTRTLTEPAMRASVPQAAWPNQNGRDLWMDPVGNQAVKFRLPVLGDTAALDAPFDPLVRNPPICWRSFVIVANAD